MTAREKHSLDEDAIRLKQKRVPRSKICFVLIDADRPIPASSVAPLHPHPLQPLTTNWLEYNCSNDQLLESKASMSVELA